MQAYRLSFFWSNSTLLCFKYNIDYNCTSMLVAKIRNIFKTLLEEIIKLYIIWYYDGYRILVIGYHGVFVVLALYVTAVQRGLHLTNRDVTLGGFFMESARRNEAHHPGFEYSSIRIKRSSHFCYKTNRHTLGFDWICFLSWCRYFYFSGMWRQIRNLVRHHCNGFCIFISTNSTNQACQRVASMMR